MELQTKNEAHISIENNMGLVYKIAFELKRLPLPREDLVSEGCIGLMKAANKYNPSRKTKFSTYAECWIKQSMYRAAEKYGSEIRVPSWMLARIRQAKRLKNFQKHERNPKEMSDSEIEKYINIGDNLRTVSIYEKYGDDETVMDSLVDDREKLPDFEIAMNERSDLIRQGLGQLGKREKRIIEMYFGLSGKPLTHLEISRRLGISRERVRQLQHEAIGKMRSNLKPFKELLAD